MPVPASSLTGNVNISGIGPSVQQLNQLAAAFNQAAASGTTALRQINASGTSTSSVFQGISLASGVRAAAREIESLGKETIDLALKADTIGTAYEGSTKRAGLASDTLLQKLQAAARGTASAAELENSANKALALGVGQNAQQIGDLLAIARQKGKDFGEDTNKAFSDITTGLGRLSPRILDNLGIILNEKEVYKDYAAQIGVAAGKLSDQEKRQALVNEVIRQNTDLVTKNASAQLSAADKIAAAQTKIHEAETKVGTFALPTVANIASAGAAIITGDLLPGAIRAREEAFAANTTSLGAYTEARQKANAADLTSGDAARAMIAALDIQTGALDKDTIALSQQAGQHERNAAAARANALADQNSAKASQDATAATIDYKKALSDLGDELSAAKRNYNDYANAVLPGTRAFEDEQSRLALASDKADLALLNFQGQGGDLLKMLDPMQREIDATKASTEGWKDKLDQATAAVDAQARVVDDAERAQRGYDTAVQDAQSNLSQQQDRLGALTDQYDALSRSISDAKRAQDDLRRTPLVGESALDDNLFNLDQQVKRARLALEQAQDRGAGKDELKRLQAEEDRRQRALDEARLRGDLTYDKQHRQIEQAGIDRKAQEKTVDDVTAAIAAQQGVIDKNTTAQQQLGQTIADQKNVVRDAQFDLMDASAVQRDHAAAVQEDKDALDKLKQSQDDISKSYDASKTLLDTLKQAYQDAKDQALKPYTDAVDAAKEAEHRLQLQHDLTTGALQHTLDEVKKNQKEMPYDEIYAGIKEWQKQVDILTTKYNDLQTAEKLANDPNTAAAGSNAFPGMHAPFAGQVGASAYSVQGINSVLAKSPLAGQGQFISEMSLKYGIPVEVALSMWKIEGDYGNLGAAVANKNPGNLRSSNLAAGTNGGFALFDTWQAGMEAFFKQLREGSQFGYPQDVDKYKGGNIDALLDLISHYAPRSDNNDPQAYYNSVKDMIRQLLAIITNGSAAVGPTAAGGRSGVINDGTMADDPQPSQYGIDSVVPGAQLGDTFDADRGSLGVHSGLDLRVKNGTPVHAPLDLRNIYTGYYPDEARRGWWATGIDEYGREWYFGHMTVLFVKNGGSIAKGGTIGTVGMGHVHVQLKQVPGGPPIDPSAALDSAAASGAGPGTGAPDPYTGQSAGAGAMYSPSRYSIGGPRFGTPITTGINGVNGAIVGLLPNLANLIRAVEGVSDATAAATDGMVNATDDILNHATYKNRDGSGQLSYLNQNGSLDAGAAGNWTRKGGGMSVGGPHFGAPIAAPPESMKGNDPTQDAIASVGAAVAGLQDTTASTFDGIAKLAPGWKDTWQQFGQATIAEMDGAQRFMEGAALNIAGYVTSAEQRIDDLIGKILSIPGIHVSTGPSQHDPGGVNDPGQPGGPSAPPAAPGPTNYNTVNYYTRDSDRAIRAARNRGYSF